ncbi:hypothetical protein MMC21_005967 [Puttea exsequens]|nr:hypothetical protein [Puttea exsequens]
MGAKFSRSRVKIAMKPQGVTKPSSSSDTAELSKECEEDHFSMAAVIRCKHHSCREEARFWGTTSTNDDAGDQAVVLRPRVLSDKVGSSPITEQSLQQLQPKDKPEILALEPIQILMSPQDHFSKLPEELRQEITSYLNYADAWSLKQTSRLFLQVVEIPTIKSFLSHPYGPSLAMLEEWDIIPVGCEACFYCRRILFVSSFSRFQRKLTASRQHAFNYDYSSWKSENHYCIACGIAKGHYPRGERIPIGLGDPGYTNSAVIPSSIGRDTIYEPRARREVYVPKDSFDITWDSKVLLELERSNETVAVFNSTMCEMSDAKREPEYYEFNDAELLLGLVDEKLLPDSGM